MSLMFEKMKEKLMKQFARIWHFFSNVNKTEFYHSQDGTPGFTAAVTNKQTNKHTQNHKKTPQTNKKKTRYKNSDRRIGEQEKPP